MSNLHEAANDTNDAETLPKPVPRPWVNMGSYCTNIAKDACSIFDAGLGKFDVAVVCHEAGPDFDHISSLRLIGSLVASSNSHSWSGLDKGTLREHAAG